MEATGEMIESAIREEISEMKKSIDGVFNGTRDGSLIIPQFIELYLGHEEKRIKKIMYLLEEWKKLN